MRTRGGQINAPAFLDDVVDRLRLPRSACSPLIRLWFSDLTQASRPHGSATCTRSSTTCRRVGLLRPRVLPVAGARGVPAAPGEPARPVRRPHRGAVAAGRRRHPRRRRSGAVGTSCWRRRRSPALRPRRSRPHRPWTWSAGTPSDGPGRPWPTRRAGSTTGTMDAEVDAAAAELEPGTVVVLPARRDRRFPVRLLACWRAAATRGAGRRRLAGLAPAARARDLRRHPDLPVVRRRAGHRRAWCSGPGGRTGGGRRTRPITSVPPSTWPWSVPAPVADTASPTSRPARDRAHGPGGDVQRGGPRPRSCATSAWRCGPAPQLRAAPRHVHGPGPADGVAAAGAGERAECNARPAGADAGRRPGTVARRTGRHLRREPLLSGRPRRWSAGERPLLSWSTATAAPRRHSAWSRSWSR